MFRHLKTSGKSILGCGLALAALIGASARAESTETVLYSFCLLSCADGSAPRADLIMDKTGNLYGTTVGGGTHNYGTVFKLAPDNTETVLYSFAAFGDGYEPSTGLVRKKRALYGTTPYGGANNLGTVYKVARDGTETLLYSFKGGSDGEGPTSGLVEDSSGNFYGTTQYGGTASLGTIFKVASDGTETVLHSFAGNPDGAGPFAGLIADSSGNLYGTTAAGGTHGLGTVFKLASNGTETVLYSFAGGDGDTPLAGVIMDGSGNLFGTTKYGGTGLGNVFKLTPNEVESSLYSFQGVNDGAYPFAGLVADRKGNLYGTTGNGGGTGCSGYGCGTVFEVSGGGSETVLHAFQGGSDGAAPLSGLIRKGSNLYGTTSAGGGSTACGSAGCGTIFEISR